MEFVKKYIIWIVLAVILLALVVVQLFVVGGKRDAARAEHEKVSKQIKKVRSLAGRISNHPTKGDLQTATQFLDLIRAEQTEVSERWRNFTCGLNRYMSGSSRKDGAIIIPGTDKYARWETFGQFLKGQYVDMLWKTERNLEKEMTDAWKIMLRDSYYAQDVSLKTPEDAMQYAEKSAPFVAKELAHIFEPKLLFEQLKVNEDELFIDERQQPLKGKGWQAWRSFLIISDIMGVIGRTKVESKRTVCAVGESAEARMQADDEDGGTKKAPLSEATFIMKDTKGWRFVENVNLLEVTRIEVGNSELVAKETLKKDDKAEEEDELAPATPEPAQPAPQPGAEVVGPKRYHDVFLVKIGFTAHLSVINEVMRELLKSPNIFYVPVGLKTERLLDADVMGHYTVPEPVKPKSLGDVREIDAFEIEPAAPIRSIAGFEHEPPVKAMLIYKVYRFRYSDTNNDKIAEEKLNENIDGFPGIN